MHEHEYVITMREYEYVTAMHEYEYVTTMHECEFLSVSLRNASDSGCTFVTCIRRFMGAFRALEETALRPLEAIARASAQISAKYRAKPILPLNLYQKRPSKRNRNA